ncbi:MAG: hypothetical protein VZQ84_01720, partial [Anaerovoracaceae bacterium]|nr:hypothetical protein [Anaerovoracaceae bacterium]
MFGKESKKMKWEDLGLTPSEGEEEYGAENRPKEIPEENREQEEDRSDVDDFGFEAYDIDEEEYNDEDEGYADFGYSEVMKREAKENKKEYRKGILMYISAFIVACIILSIVC